MPTAPFDDLWVVIPVFNEARVLGETLAAVTAVFPHVCVVDDASSDGSGSVAWAFASRGVRVLTHSINLGQGAALQTGFDYVLLDRAMQRVVTFDADGQHLVSDAVRLAERLADGFDVVLGSRFLGAAPQMGLFRRLLLWAAVRYTSFSVKLPLTDTHNGLRALNRRAVSAMRLTQGGMAHATEILERIKSEALSYTEEGVVIRYSDYSRSKGQSLLNSVNILVDLLVR